MQLLGYAIHNACTVTNAGDIVLHVTSFEEPEPAASATAASSRLWLLFEVWNSGYKPWDDDEDAASSSSTASTANVAVAGRADSRKLTQTASRDILDGTSALKYVNVDSATMVFTVGAAFVRWLSHCDPCGISLCPAACSRCHGSVAHWNTHQACCERWDPGSVLASGRAATS